VTYRARRQRPANGPRPPRALTAGLLLFAVAAAAAAAAVGSPFQAKPQCTVFFVVSIVHIAAYSALLSHVLYA